MLVLLLKKSLFNELRGQDAGSCTPKRSTGKLLTDMDEKGESGTAWTKA
jgi:hypothetical protein